MATEIIRKGAGAGASRLMNREEYYHIADSDDGYVSELVRGMVVRDPGIMWEHGHLQGKLFRYLDEWMERFGQGMVSVDCGCILAEDPDTVRFPDVAVLLRQSARDWLHGAPDVAWLFCFFKSRHAKNIFIAVPTPHDLRNVIFVKDVTLK